jgi:hypothetical protein
MAAFREKWNNRKVPQDSAEEDEYVLDEREVENAVKLRVGFIFSV